MCSECLLFKCHNHYHNLVKYFTWGGCSLQVRFVQYMHSALIRRRPSYSEMCFCPVLYIFFLCFTCMTFGNDSVGFLWSVNGESWWILRKHPQIFRHIHKNSMKTYCYLSVCSFVYMTNFTHAYSWAFSSISLKIHNISEASSASVLSNDRSRASFQNVLYF
jgi:amino acid permease